MTGACPLYATVIGVLIGAGLVTLTRYSSFLRILIGIELVSGAATASIVLVGGDIGLYVFLALIETVMAGIAAAIAFSASRRRGVMSIDSFSEEVRSRDESS